MSYRVDKNRSATSAPRVKHAERAVDRYTPARDQKDPAVDDSDNMADNPHNDHHHHRSSPYLPRVYSPEIDGLANRAIRAYLLVINYERDCPDGRRWTPEHIDEIRWVGKYLQADHTALLKMRAALQRGDDAVSVSKIRAEAKHLREYCKETQALIKKHEQDPVFNKRPVDVDRDGRSFESAMQGTSTGYDGANGHHHATSEYGRSDKQLLHTSINAFVDNVESGSHAADYWRQDRVGRRLLEETYSLSAI